MLESDDYVKRTPGVITLERLRSDIAKYLDMMNKFTVEEINFMCVFETQNRMKMMEEIRRVMSHIKDSDMEELSRQVLRKLDGMTDKEFAENSLEAVEE